MASSALSTIFLAASRLSKSKATIISGFIVISPHGKTVADFVNFFKLLSYLKPLRFIALILMVIYY